MVPSLRQLSSRRVANRLGGDIDQRIHDVSYLGLDYLAQSHIINELERDKQLILDFYNGENENEKMETFLDYIKNNEFDKVNIILKYYPEYINLQDDDDYTALMYAAEYDFTGNLVDRLLSMGIDNPYKTNYRNETAYLIAILEVNLNALRKLNKYKIRR